VTTLNQAEFLVPSEHQVLPRLEVFVNGHDDVIWVDAVYVLAKFEAPAFLLDAQESDVGHMIKVHWHRNHEVTPEPAWVLYHKGELAACIFQCLHARLQVFYCAGNGQQYAVEAIERKAKESLVRLLSAFKLFGLVNVNYSLPVSELKRDVFIG